MYATRKVTPDDYKCIKYLYLKCFKKDFSINDFRVKYFAKNEFNFIGIIALDSNDLPAAIYGVFVTEIVISNQKFKVAQSGDTMTHPTHQKKGLFTKLAQETYKNCLESGVSLVFGLPNQQSYPGFKYKLNWEFIGMLKRFSIKTNTIPICETLEYIKFLKIIYWKLCSIQLRNYTISYSEYIEIKKSVSHFNKIPKFLHTNLIDKVNRNNTYIIEYYGFIILFKIDTHLIIGDVVFQDNFDPNKLIFALRRLAKKLFCYKTIIGISENHWMYQSLLSHLKSSDGLPIGYLNLRSELKFSHIPISMLDLETF
jgi:hypothetical protein